jgi:putative protease
VKRNHPEDTADFKPAIMAPAGSRASFLAAVAAGADAIYCGTKLFSARMQAQNFSPQELKPLVDLAHDRGIRVFVTLNTLLKPDDLDTAGKLIQTLTSDVQPDGLIIQDLAVLSLVRQTGFRGEIKLSTLANVSFGQALALAAKTLRVDRVVLPRELNIDEIKAVAQVCPPGLGLEVFIHGALCYAVSGRCYWSSYLGGKSGLRGRCVQPCRRVFNQSSDHQTRVQTTSVSSPARISAWMFWSRYCCRFPRYRPGKSRAVKRAPITFTIRFRHTGCYVIMSAIPA